MKLRLYLETTIPSYLVARASRDAILRGQQAATRKWWEQRRSHFELFVSEFVDIEAGSGDAEMSAARAAAMRGLPRLAATEDVREREHEAAAHGVRFVSPAPREMEVSYTLNDKPIKKGK